MYSIIKNEPILRTRNGLRPRFLDAGLALVIKLIAFICSVFHAYLTRPEDSESGHRENLTGRVSEKIRLTQ